MSCTNNEVFSMAKYKVTDSSSGRTVQLTGESPPTEKEIEGIFKQLEREQNRAKDLALAERSDQVSREHTRQTLAEAAVKEEGPEEISDVLLDIPTLKIDEIKLVVDNLEARVALDAAIANNLVRLIVGAQVGIGKVDLDIKGVEAQAVLKVKLRQVNMILARTLDTLDRNPELIRNLGEAVAVVGKEAGRAVGELGTQAGRALGPGGPVGEAIGQVGKSLGPGGPVGDTVGQIGKSLGPGGPLGETAGQVGEGAREALGPGGGVRRREGDKDETAQEGEAAREVMGPEGGVRRRTGDTTERNESVTAAEGPVKEAVKDVSKGVDETIEGKNRVREKERRHFLKKKKEKANI
jgi:hypothetical protein